MSFSDRKRSLAAADAERAFKNRIDIKFREGSVVRARDGRLVVLEGATEDAASVAEVAAVSRLLADLPNHAVVRMHDLSEAALEGLKRDGERKSGRTLPDLNLWFHLYVDVESTAALADLVNRLNALDVVEYAAPSPLPAPPPGMPADKAEAFEAYWREHDIAPWPTTTALQKGAAGPAGNVITVPGQRAIPPVKAVPDAPPLPGNYLSFQDYREAAPIGIDVNYVVSRYFGATGMNWGYTDCEYSWTKTHEDLTPIAGSVYANGTPSAGAMDYRDHGTAVVGQLSSVNNGWGTTGLVPDSMVRLSTEWPTTGYNRASAITAAAAQFWRGAVILLEMQTGASFDCNGADSSAPYVPAEWDPAVKSAVMTATANGRIVVAAAGNGNCDLDQAGFGGAFNPASVAQDSGAIIVGAGEKLTRNKASFSTYGSRVDAHAEGDWQIYTTGYGDLFSAEGENRWYTDSFSGTSGASPIVTGAAVSLSAMLWLNHGSIWAPREIRDILRRDGTPQGTGGHIGRRPDLKKQVEAMTNRHLQMQSADFDGDGRSDYTTWRPSTGTWYIRYANGTTGTQQWGQRGDIPAPADVNGDGRAELIVFRPSNGRWYIRYWNATTQSIQWGTRGDVPVPLDYDGDGRDDLVVFRTLTGGSVGRWYIRPWRGATTTITWGQRNDTPIARDMNGDGRDDLIVFRGLEGRWYIRYSGSGATARYDWGAWGDIPLTYRDSLRRWNIAVWRPSNATYYARNIHSGATATVQWGMPGDVPRFADRDGNGWDEWLVYRPSNRTWYNASFGPLVFGGVGDIAVAQ